MIPVGLLNRQVYMQLCVIKQEGKLTFFEKTVKDSSQSFPALDVIQTNLLPIISVQQAKSTD